MVATASGRTSRAVQSSVSDFVQLALCTLKLGSFYFSLLTASLAANRDRPSIIDIAWANHKPVIIFNAAASTSNGIHDPWNIRRRLIATYLRAFICIQFVTAMAMNGNGRTTVESSCLQASSKVTNQGIRSTQKKSSFRQTDLDSVLCQTRPGLA
jgi:hypothetical protein